MAYVKFLLFQLAMIAMLYMGLTGIDGAFNVYGAVVGVFVGMYIFMWSDGVRDAVVTKIQANQQQGIISVPGWLRYTVLGGQALVLVWFGYFLLAGCLAFLMFTLHGRIDSAVQPTTVPTE